MILKYSTVVTVYSSSVASSRLTEVPMKFINTLDLPCTEDGKAPWNGGPPWTPHGLKQAVRTIGSRVVSVTVYV